MDESVEHTLRTLSGYCDAVVTRFPFPLDARVLPIHLPCPIVSGGDRGLACEHPSQALIDVFAFRREFGGVAGLDVVIVGDPKMRAVASLCRLLVRHGVGSIGLLTVPGLLEGLVVPDAVRPLLWVLDGWSDAGRADCLYVAGIPHASVSLADRDLLRLTPERLARLGGQCVVTSPLPVVDEVDREVWTDTRARAFRHSDDGLFVRMAILELVLG